MTNPKDSPNPTPTTQISTPPVSDDVPTPSIAGQRSTTAAITTQTSTLPISDNVSRPNIAGEGSTISPMPSLTRSSSIVVSADNSAATRAVAPPTGPSGTRAPSIVVATDSSTTTAFVGGANLGEHDGRGGASGGGAVAVTAGMAVLQLGGSSARVKAGMGSTSGRVQIGQRKRTRDQGEGGGVAERAAGPPPPPPPAGPPPRPAGPPFICPVCRRDDFHSFRSLSGHMKVHPERNWRGLNPPPVFDREEFGDALAQFGGASGSRTAEKPAAGQGGDAGGVENVAELLLAAAKAVTAAGVAETAEGLDDANVEPLDLNRSPAKEEEESPPPPSASSSGKHLDLNRTPSPED